MPEFYVARCYCYHVLWDRNRVFFPRNRVLIVPDDNFMFVIEA